MNNKLANIFRVLAFMVACTFFLSGKPPAKAQKKVSSLTTVVTSKDEQQDVKLGRMEEWHVEQQGWNQLTGAQIAMMVERQNKIDDAFANLQGEIMGGFGLLTLLTGLGVFFQVKKRRE